jgi:hypothetical protein
LQHPTYFSADKDRLSETEPGLTDISNVTIAKALTDSNGVIDKASISGASNMLH